MEKTKDRFVVWVHVKPYVRRYLLRNFRVRDDKWRNLVNLSGDQELSTFVDISLKKPIHRYDKRCEGKVYRCRVAIEITKDTFYRHGWALSPTDEMRLNRILELRCQVIAKTFLSTNYLWNGNLAECIRKMYKVFGWTEDDWDIDTIRKMWFRDKFIPKECICSQIYKEKTKFILEHLSKLGTISNLGKEEYERNLSEI